MKKQKLFSVRDFARLSRTTRNTLHHYDSIGLLPPSLRGENNYRYYSTEQISIVSFIRILRELGMTLDEMNAIKDKRSPEIMNALLISQIGTIDKKIDDWVRARKLLLTLQNSIQSALDVDEQAVTIQFLPAEAIILGGVNDFSRGRDDYTALLNFYNDMQEKYPDLDLNYPVWARFKGERIQQGDWHWPDRYYFYNPEGHDRRPAALYAIGYARGGYGQTDELYKRMTAYIDENGFEICGDVYEEYPLNEFSVADAADYLIRVRITVREKSPKQSG